MKGGEILHVQINMHATKWLYSDIQKHRVIHKIPFVGECECYDGRSTFTLININYFQEYIVATVASYIDLCFNLNNHNKNVERACMAIICM